MAHPVTRLTAGSTFKKPDAPRGGLPELTTQEIAAAAAQMPDRLAYHAVMTHVCDQHPPKDVWPELMLDLQSAVVRAWSQLKRARRVPKSMKLDTIHGVASAAWREFASNRKLTVSEKAQAADMKLETFKMYADLHAEAVKDINTRLNWGLRYIRDQLKETG